MRKTVQIKIGNTNPPQKFDTGIELKVGDFVVVETATGAEWGVVDSQPCEAKGKTENNQVLRVADVADKKIIDKLITSATYAMKIAGERIEKYKLSMKLLSAAYSFDGNKVVIQFFSENRVDFRELVKDLAYSLRTRIELRQVGARDEAKIVGAMGQCGMQCCCGRFIKDFDNITIKMAKNQNISLNPQKINGMCGRLLCCLGYENDYYAEMQDKMPRYGSEVATPDGKGTAQDNNMLTETVNVKFQNGDTSSYKCYKLCDLKCKQCGRKDQ
ncbi:MAG: stage 0 sporulation protein [Christensenellaceae bacterium]|jgi:cell fate regulator YaaT (PSP1 superfamily)|nr:stage 0 sporulation protein [Christensenellaceae bacterium]